MSTFWSSPSIAACWTIVFILIGFVHVWHVALLPGRHRLWHGGHTLMTLGMIIMSLPSRTMLVPPATGTVVFTLAALALAGYVLSTRLRGGGVGGLWAAGIIDLGWMAVMFTEMTAAGPAWVNIIGAVWFVAQALGWATGLLGRVLDRHGLGSASAAAGPEEHHYRRADDGGVVDGGTHDWSVRVSLTLMGLGMAYMLLAFNYGTSGSMPGMSPMPEMGGSTPGMQHAPPSPGGSPGKPAVPASPSGGPTPSPHPMPSMPGM
jgi:hypothetical protein